MTTDTQTIAGDGMRRPAQISTSVQSGTGFETVRQVTDDVGEAIEDHDYLPFGEEVTSAHFRPLQFTGHERDRHGAGPDADLDYMHARYAHIGLARFLSVDSHSSTPAAPQGWNRYSYAKDNPLRFVDPTGRTVESAFNLIASLKPAILAASDATNGLVSPLDIARVLFQENRNDFNLIRVNRPGNPGGSDS